MPLNDVMAKRTSAIAKETSAARDNRMGILNELITAIRFIKFFAWEDRWVQRVLDARAIELRWLIKGIDLHIIQTMHFADVPLLQNASTL